MRRIKLAVRLAVAALVVGGIWFAVEKTMEQLREKNIAPSDLLRLDWGWVAASGLFYLASLAPAGWFWGKALYAMGQRPAAWPLARAYLIGHLGKYVPGKAMVVVLRAGLVRGPQVDTTVAAVGVFVETLTLMAVGAFLAAALLAFRALAYGEHTMLALIGAAMMLGAGVPTAPPIFRRLVMLAQVKRINPLIEHALAGLNWRVMLWGWALMVVAWGLMGLSLWAALRSIPGVSVGVEHLPLALATVALALVAGFVLFIPGGLGVRELVVIPLLAPVFGYVPAVVSAVVLRLVWLAAELAASGIVYLIPARDASAPRHPNSEHRPTETCNTV